MPGSPGARCGCGAGQGAGQMGSIPVLGIGQAGSSPVLGITHPSVCVLWIYWVFPSLHC